VSGEQHAKPLTTGPGRGNFFFDDALAGQVETITNFKQASTGSLGAGFRRHRSAGQRLDPVKPTNKINKFNK
jgi:hypothetical protein